MISREEIFQLDDQRYYDATAVLEVLRRRVAPGEISPQNVPLALGVVGSTLRMLLDYSAAEIVLKRGMALAEASRNSAAFGDLHQRLSYIWYSHTDFEAALEENETAIARHEEEGDDLGVARSLVDRGMFLGSLGLFERSSNSFREALKRLPDSQERHRFGALHGLSHNLLEVGEPAQALPVLAEAERSRVDPHASAQLRWLHGNLLSELGQHDEAPRKLRTAVSELLVVSPIKAALAATDLLRALLLAGKGPVACKVAADMLKFTELLKNYRAARLAAVELAGLGSRSALTLEAVRHSRSAIERASRHAGTAPPLGSYPLAITAPPLGS